jgi:hypothetical protein
MSHSRILCMVKSSGLCVQNSGGFFPTAQQPLVGQGLILEASWSHSDTPHSVEVLRTSDQPDARDVYVTTHTTFTRDRHPCPRWDSNPQSQKANGLRPCGHWDRLTVEIRTTYSCEYSFMFCLLQGSKNFQGFFFAPGARNHSDRPQRKLWT